MSNIKRYHWFFLKITQWRKKKHTFVSFPFPSYSYPNFPTCASSTSFNNLTIWKLQCKMHRAVMIKSLRMLIWRNRCGREDSKFFWWCPDRKIIFDFSSCPYLKVENSYNIFICLIRVHTYTYAHILCHVFINYFIYRVYQNSRIWYAKRDSSCQKK